MKQFTFKGFKLAHPDHFKAKGNHLCIEITNPKSKLPRFSFVKMYLGLDLHDHTFEMNYEAHLDPGKYDKHRVVRAGDYAKFSGAKQIFLKTLFTADSVMFDWHVLIPVGKRCFNVHWMAIHDDTDRSVPPDFTEFYEEWIPIVDSMEFDAELINTLPDFPCEEKNWAKASDKPRRFKKTISPAEFVGLYDSETGFFDKNNEGWVAEVDADNVEARFIKEKGRLILFPHGEEASAIPIEFLLGAGPPTLDGWDKVIEGLISIDSGKLCFGAEEPEIKFKLQPGVYRYRVCFGAQVRNGDDERPEYWSIYLWPGEEKETNEVIILK